MKAWRVHSCDQQYQGQLCESDKWTQFYEKNQTPILCTKKAAKKNFDTSAGKTYEGWRRLVTRNPLTDRRGKNVDQN
jgi:hypothetical protein